MNVRSQPSSLLERLNQETEELNQHTYASLNKTEQKIQQVFQDRKKQCEQEERDVQAFKQNEAKKSAAYEAEQRHIMANQQLIFERQQSQMYSQAGQQQVKHYQEYEKGVSELNGYQKQLRTIYAEQDEQRKTLHEAKLALAMPLANQEKFEEKTKQKISKKTHVPYPENKEDNFGYPTDFSLSSPQAAYPASNYFGFPPEQSSHVTGEIFQAQPGVYFEEDTFAAYPRYEEEAYLDTNRVQQKKMDKNSSYCVLS